MIYPILVVFLLTAASVISVEVEFLIVDVPKYYTPLNGDVYISGSFNQWSLKQHKLTRLTHNQFKINLDLPHGLHEFKFSRGSLNTTETELDGSVKRTRKLKITSADKQTVSVRVQNWQDMVGNHTAVGNVFHFSNMAYPQFNTTKDVWIYVPSDYFYTNKTYPVMYMSDGGASFDKFCFNGQEELECDEVIEGYVKKGKQTAIIVAIATPYPLRPYELTPYPNKNEELQGGKADLFLDFLINKVKPFVDSHFRTKPGREHTAIFGISLGGQMSCYAGIKHQNVFGKTFVFSGSFWFNSTIFKLANETQFRYNNTKFYFLVGGQENSEEHDIDMVSDMMKMVNIFIDKGHKKNVKHLIATDGTHEGWFWRREFPAAYEWMFSV